MRENFPHKSSKGHVKSRHCRVRVSHTENPSRGAAKPDRVQSQGQCGYTVRSRTAWNMMQAPAFCLLPTKQNHYTEITSLNPSLWYLDWACPPEAQVINKNTWFLVGRDMLVGVRHCWRKYVTRGRLWGFKSFVPLPAVFLLPVYCLRCEPLAVTSTMSACCPVSLSWWWWTLILLKP